MDRKYITEALRGRHASDEEMEKACQQVWQEFWLPILLKKHIDYENFPEVHVTDGEVRTIIGVDPEILEQIKSELYDAHTLMRNMSVVYSELTGGRISKPMTDPVAVFGEMEERRQEDLGWGIRDWLEAKLDEHDPAVIRSLINEVAEEYGLTSS